MKKAFYLSILLSTCLASQSLAQYNEYGVQTNQFNQINQTNLITQFNHFDFGENYKDKMVTPDSSKLICTIEHDIIHCTDSNFIPYTGMAYAMHTPNRVAVKAFYKDGKREGIFKAYYESGQLKFESNWKDGKLEGIFKAYYENGQLEFEGNFRDDKLEGIAKFYYENGQLKEERNSRDGIIIKISKHDRCGNLIDGLEFYREMGRQLRKLKAETVIEINDFLYLCNDFEEEKCQNDCNVGKLAKLVSNRTTEKYWKELAEVLQNRVEINSDDIESYTNNKLSIGKELKNIEKEYVKEFINTKGEDSLVGGLIAAYRIRNTYHGLKDLSFLDEQIELFKGLNNFLRTAIKEL